MQPCGVGGPLPVHLAPPPTPDSLNGPQSQGRGAGAADLCAFSVSQLYVGQAHWVGRVEGGAVEAPGAGGCWQPSPVTGQEMPPTGASPMCPVGCPSAPSGPLGGGPSWAQEGLMMPVSAEGAQGTPRASAGSWESGATVPFSHTWVCRRQSRWASGCPGRRVRASGLRSFTSPWLAAARQTPPAQSSGQRCHICISGWTQPPLG